MSITAVPYTSVLQVSANSVLGNNTGAAAPAIALTASQVAGLIGSSITTVGTVTSGTLSTGAVIGGVTVTLGSDATGDIFYRNSGGVFTRLGIGSTGQVLTVDGGLPSWAAAAGGGGDAQTANPLSQFAATTSAQLRGVLSDETGTGSAVFSTSPTFDGNTIFTQPVSTSGSPTQILVTGAAHTTLAASTEAVDVNFNLARTVQFATGAKTTQRAMLIQAPTYSAVGATTITTASTLSVSGAPVAGTNATITKSYALNVESGNSYFGGGVTALTAWNAGFRYSAGSAIWESTNCLVIDIGAWLRYDYLINRSGIAMARTNDQYIGWAGYINATNPTVDTRIYSDNSGILALRNSTNVQSLGVYGTYTSSTNYERINIRGKASANFEIGPENGSAGGTLRGLTIGGYTAGSSTITPWLTFTSAGAATFAATLSGFSLPASETIGFHNGSSWWHNICQYDPVNSDRPALCFQNGISRGFNAANMGMHWIPAGGSGPELTLGRGSGVVSTNIVTHTSPASYARIVGGSGSGTNVAATSMYLAGGRGTGTGAGGSVIIQVAPAGASGSALNTLVDVITVSATTTNAKITATTSTIIPLTIKAAASQSANLQEWQNSSGTVLCSITESGDIKTGAIIRQSSEVTSTPSGTTQTITLNNGNHQTLDLTSSSGDVTATLTVPTSSAAGTIIVKQHASTPRNLTWAVSAGTIKWMGTQPTWNSDAVSTVRVVSWRYDGSVTYLAATDVGT